MNLITSFLLSISLFLQTQPQPPARSGDARTDARGTFIALSVADVEVVSRWYCDTLGLKVIKAGEAPNKIAKFALLEGEGVLIEVIQHSKARARSTAAPSVVDAYQLHGIFKVGLIVADLDATYRRLKEMKVTIAYELMPAKDVPLRSFTVRDPEGNLIQFFGK